MLDVRGRFRIRDDELGRWERSCRSKTWHVWAWGLLHRDTGRDQLGMSLVHPGLLLPGVCNQGKGERRMRWGAAFKVAAAAPWNLLEMQVLKLQAHPWIRQG